MYFWCSFYSKHVAIYHSSADFPFEKNDHIRSTYFTYYPAYYFLVDAQKERISLACTNVYTFMNVKLIAIWCLRWQSKIGGNDNYPKRQPLSYSTIEMVTPKWLVDKPSGPTNPRGYPVHDSMLCCHMIVVITHQHTPLKTLFSWWWQCWWAAHWQDYIGGWKGSYKLASLYEKGEKGTSCMVTVVLSGASIGSGHGG